MSFSDTYAQEVLQSRRTRAQRAGFWAKIVSFLLMITIAATLRSEPELRQALVGAGTDAVLQMTGRSAQSTETMPSPALPDQSQMQQLLAKAQSDGTLQKVHAEPFQVQQPTSKVKVNRFGTSQIQGPSFQTAPIPAPSSQTDGIRAEDTQAMADQLGTLLEQMRPNK